MKYYMLIDETGWVGRNLIGSLEKAEEKAKFLLESNAWTETSYFDILEINTRNKEIKGVKRIVK